ncbi:MAG TPA: hypothetical protein VN885_02860 [Candidatus Acidoferrales bacterium]|nr:hypothetical protein [Candidatus Acidoferrales bacterium]
MNRRKLLSLLGMSPAILAGESVLAAQGEKKPAPATHSSAAPAKPGTGPAKITTVNPKGMPPQIQLIPMAPRLDSLDGKTVYLVDTGFHGSDMLLEQIQEWFKTNMPGVTTVFKRKAGPYAQDDPALWKEIKEKGNAVIMAVGH